MTREGSGLSHGGGPTPTSSAGTAGKIGTSNLGAINFLGPEGDLVVQLTKGPTDEPIEIIPINDTGPSSAYPFFGAVASSTNYLPLQAGSGGTAGFGGVAHTPAGSPPSSVYAESTIWLVDPVSLEIKAEWTELNGTRHPAIIAYSVRENVLFLTGDIQAYLNSHPNYFASPVTFHLVSPSTTTSVTSCDGSYTL